MTIRPSFTAGAIALGLAMASAGSAAPVVISFPEHNPPTSINNFDSDTDTHSAASFDGATNGLVGANQTYTNGADSVTITTVDIEAPLYDTSGASPVLTGTILKASTSTATGFRIVTNTPSTFTALGINSEQFSNTGSEQGQINEFEAWIFEFDKDIVLDQIAVASVASTDTFEMRVEDVATVFSFGDVNPAAGDDVYVDPFGGLVIPAGKDVTFRSTAPGLPSAGVGVRIKSMAATVPEPTSLAFVAVGALALSARRRRG